MGTVLFAGSSFLSAYGFACFLVKFLLFFLEDFEAFVTLFGVCLVVGVPKVLFSEKSFGVVYPMYISHVLREPKLFGFTFEAFGFKFHVGVAWRGCLRQDVFGF